MRAATIDAARFLIEGLVELVAAGQHFAECALRDTDALDMSRGQHAAVRRIETDHGQRPAGGQHLGGGMRVIEDVGFGDR